MATSRTSAVRNTTTKLLDEIKKVKGVESDYRLAKLLEVQQQTITNYRSGRNQMSYEIAIRAARMMGRPPEPLFAQLASDRSQTPEVAKVWKRMAEMLGRQRHNLTLSERTGH